MQQRGKRQSADKAESDVQSPPANVVRLQVRLRGFDHSQILRRQRRRQTGLVEILLHGKVELAVIFHLTLENVVFDGLIGTNPHGLRFPRLNRGLRFLAPQGVFVIAPQTADQQLLISFQIALGVGNLGIQRFDFIVFAG